MEPKCFNCEKTVTDDMYCSGCKSYICEECRAGYSIAAAFPGNHDREDHLVDYDGEDL